MFLEHFILQTKEDFCTISTERKVATVGEFWDVLTCTYYTGMTNRSNQVDFAKSTFYFEISL